MPFKLLLLLFVIAFPQLGQAQSNLILKCFLEQTAEPSKEADPTVIINVSYKQGIWAVDHLTQSGRVVPRSDTYVMRDISKPAQLGWEGHMPKNPSLRMTGRLSNFGTGSYIYAERQFDSRKAGQAANLTLFLCREQAR